MTEPCITKGPCKGCPWNRAVTPGALGGSSPDVYVGQITGPFWLPCHAHSEFNDPNWKTNVAKPQCAGAAIFRANIGVADKMPEFLLRLPPDTTRVFASYEEFLQHHTMLPISTVRWMLAMLPPERLMQEEYAKARIIQMGGTQ